jgi:thioredoxin
MNTKERTLIEVTEASFGAEVIKAKVPVIVDFYADYCVPCRIFKPFLARFADELGDGAKVVTVDAVATPGLSQYYRISAVPTLIIFKNGKETTRFAGLVSEDVLRDALTGDVK